MNLPREPVWLLGDAVRLSHSFGNLLNNAARYTPTGGSIWPHAALEGDGTACVSHTGAGFTPQTKDRMFKMFARSKGSSGLGIGLALARKLIEIHGGQVDARSDGEGPGAEFVVRVPLTQAPSCADAPHGAGRWKELPSARRRRQPRRCRKSRRATARAR